MNEEATGSVTLEAASTPSSGSVPLRSSARVSKKKLDSLTKLTLSPSTEKRDLDKDDVQEVGKRPNKKPSIWPMEDKNLFFEAVNEYGKDFAAIQRYFVLKNKNKNSEVKTKEQIRRFYYRTWAKISPDLHFPPHIQKQTQELYGLINYGELRKKLKARSKKNSLRLNELIIRGFTQCRGKNKTINVRTPRCRILRRLCRVEDSQETDTKLPSSVRIELMPADNDTWSHVQSLAQNPRMLVQVPLQYRLHSLIQYLQRRWLSRHHKYKMKVMEGYDGDSGLTETKDKLVLRVKPNADVHLSQVNCSHFNSHTKICLSSYEEMLGKKGSSLELLNKLYAEVGSKVKKQKLDNVSDKEAKKEDVKEDGRETIRLELDERKEEGDVTSSKEQSIAEEYSMLVGSVLKDDSSLLDEEEPKKEGPDVVVDAEAVAAAEEQLAKIKEGWTVDNCHALTVGDLYLMVGNDFKIELDYVWQPAADTSLIQLTSVLSKLVRLAKLSRSRSAIQCPCGHLCSESKRPRKDSFNDEGGIGVQLASGESPFRRPVLQSGTRRVAAGTGRLTAESFRAQLDKLTPKYCNRRGRAVSGKTVVVQRTLPILPKATNGATVVTLKVIPQAQQPTQVVEQVQVIVPEETPCATDKPADPPPPPPLVPPPSPTPSISTILEEPFKGFTPCSNFSENGNDGGEVISEGSVVKDGWLSEVAECSLSSLLSHLETPIKNSSMESFESAPPDVETQFQYLMTEASLDFTAKFAALAAEVSSETSQ